ASSASPQHCCGCPLSTWPIEAAVEGAGLLIKVHFTKKQGAPVHFIGADDPQSAAAVREIDLQKKFHFPPAQLAKAIGLTGPRCRALIEHLALDADTDCHHVFNHGKSKFPSYSDNAVRKLKEATNSLDLDEVWRLYRAKSGFGGRQAKRVSIAT
ncbi:hypothetical protein, partial [uncultured Sphingomonas sp.]|uniref:hypothetical protein n=1 Tax=uncultured Sphingomonas sp. TaxID=158754 RepID=UPI0035CAD7D0